MMGERRTPGGPLQAVRALKAAIAQKRSHVDDAGAALILALVFLIVAALTLTALVTFAGTGLLDTAGFTSQRSLQYGANGAVEIAIQRVRYEATSYPALENCLGTTPSSSVQLTEYQRTAQYRVYCKGTAVPEPTFSSSAYVSGTTVTTTRLFTTAHASFVGYGFSVVGTSTVTSIVAETTSAHTVQLKTLAQSGTETVELIPPYQRLVTFYACRATTCSVVTTRTVTKMTPAKVLVKAVVGFGDLASTGADTCSTASIRTCGESMIVTQWTVSSANH